MIGTKRQREIVLNGAFALLVVIALAYIFVALSGCASQPPIESNPPHTALGDALGSLTPSDPTKAAAHQALWPFTWVGALTLLAGVVWLVLFRQPLVLIIGSVLAAVPFVLIYTSTAFLVPVAIGVAAIGVITLGAAAGRWLGWWEWDKKTSERAAYLRAMMTDGKVPPDQINLTGEVARALEWVGKRSFDAKARELPHDELNIQSILLTEPKR